MKQVEERQKPTIPRTEFFATISQLSKASHLQNSSSLMSQSCCEHGREGYVGGGFHASAPSRSVRQVEIWHVQGKIPLLPHRQFPDQEEIHCHGAHPFGSTHPFRLVASRRYAWSANLPRPFPISPHRLGRINQMSSFRSRQACTPMVSPFCGAGAT